MLAIQFAPDMEVEYLEYFFLKLWPSDCKRFDLCSNGIFTYITPIYKVLFISHCCKYCYFNYKKILICNSVRQLFYPF
jgi:hypothetical protein